MKNARSNFKLISILFLIAAVICLLLSKLVNGKEVADGFKFAGILFLVIAILQLIVYRLYPGLYNNKREIK